MDYNSEHRTFCSCFFIDMPTDNKRETDSTLVVDEGDDSVVLDALAEKEARRASVETDMRRPQNGHSGGAGGGSKTDRRAGFGHGALARQRLQEESTDCTRRRTGRGAGRHDASGRKDHSNVAVTKPSKAGE
jgi:hypothetical protein